MPVQFRYDACDLSEELFAKTVGVKVRSMRCAEVTHAGKHLQPSIFGIVQGENLLRFRGLKVVTARSAVGDESDSQRSVHGGGTTKCQDVGCATTGRITITVLRS